MKSVIQKSKRLIIKVGSSLVTNDGKGLDTVAIAKWANQIAQLRLLGKEVVFLLTGENCKTNFSASPWEILIFSPAYASALATICVHGWPAVARKRATVRGRVVHAGAGRECA